MTDEVLLQSRTSAVEDTRRLSLQDTIWGTDGERESGSRLILKSIRGPQQLGRARPTPAVAWNPGNPFMPFSKTRQVDLAFRMRKVAHSHGPLLSLPL